MGRTLMFDAGHSNLVGGRPSAVGRPIRDSGDEAPARKDLGLLGSAKPLFVGAGEASRTELPTADRRLPTGLVSSATPYACALACLESWARERGVTFDHAAYIAKQGSAPAGWDRMPGLTNLNIAQVGGVWTLRWDVYDLARDLGLAHSLAEFQTRPPLEAFLERPGNAVFALLRRYPEPGDPCTHAHCVRIVASGEGRVRFMDPGRHLPARWVDLDWETFRTGEPRVFGMARD